MNSKKMDESRLLVINADDLGYSAQRDRGIIESKKRSVITSASLMVNGVHAMEAVAMATTAGLSIGLHLNLTEGTPVGKTDYKTIVNDKGLFHGKFGFRNELKAGNIDLNEVRRETISQIEKFREMTGDLPGHVNGHQHVHVAPGVCDVFAEVLKENGIHITRLLFERNLEQCDWIDSTRMTFYKEVIRQAETCAQVFRQHSLQLTNSFAGLSTSGEDMTVERLKQAIGKSFPGIKSGTSSLCDESTVTTRRIPAIHTCELMVHPGYPTGTVGGCGAGPDPYSQSRARKNEMDVLCHPDIKQYLIDNNIHVCSFKECFHGNSIR